MSDLTHTLARVDGLLDELAAQMHDLEQAATENEATAARQRSKHAALAGERETLLWLRLRFTTEMAGTGAEFVSLERDAMETRMGLLLDVLQAAKDAHRDLSVKGIRFEDLPLAMVLAVSISRFEEWEAINAGVPVGVPA